MRVLIIEDEQDVSGFIKKGLVAEGFLVDSAYNGEDGVSLATDNNYGLIILDLGLPDKSGMEVCRDIRAQGKDLPIIILSVTNDTSVKIDLLDMGADDYVTKPFSFGELLARIGTLLRRKKTIDSDKLIFADIEMDIVSHSVLCSGVSLYLSKKEFELLEYFMRNIGKVLTRNMILENIWDINADPFTNTVDVHVRFLREKIGKKSRGKHIHTVHGYGYKME